MSDLVEVVASLTTRESSTAHHGLFKLHRSPVIYECHLTEADYRAFRRHVKNRYFKMRWLYGVMLLVWLAAVWLGGAKDESVEKKIYLMIGTLVLCVMFLVVLTGVLALFRFVTGQRFRGPLGRHLFEVSPGGIKETNDFGTSETKLIAIRAVDETVGYYFVVTKSGLGYIIPKRGHMDFNTLQELRQRVLQNRS